MSDQDLSEDAVELPIDGTLDLHPFHPRDVPDLVPTYLDACKARGILEVRIVHGKGKGALRRIVQSALARRSDVARVSQAPPERGGWGATLVSLRPDGCG